MNEKSKHIDLKYQMIMDNARKGTVSVSYISRKEMVADARTKNLPWSTFHSFVKKMGFHN